MAEVYTIGHSTRSIEDFLSLLQAHGMELLVDVRTVPRSRRNPQFNRETLPETLAAQGIGYRHEPALGGLRKARADSPNLAWRNDSFRGYADYMQTAPFAQGVDRLIGTAAEQRTVIMCAESLPWQCHRSLVADALLARGVSARHILSASRADVHRFTSFARVEGTKVWYPLPLDVK